MKTLLFFVVYFYGLILGNCYSKYGRTCKDIGCTSNEVCVMHEDPCPRFKPKECGTYPTCQRVRNALASCDTYVCPPTQVCKVDNGQPKCFNSKAGAKHKKRSIQSYTPSYTSSTLPPYNSQTLSRASYYSQNSNYPVNPGYNPSYTSSDIYPNLPSVGQAYGSTTQRYYNYPQGQNVQQGYYGQTTPRNYYGQTTQRNYYGQTTSRANSYPTQRYQPGVYPGYPSQSSSYPSQSSGYPSQGNPYPSQGSAYPSQGSRYPSQGSGYPSQGSAYPTQGSRYPSQGSAYPTQGSRYPTQGSGYPTYPGYPTQQGRYPSQGNGYRDQPYNQKNYYNQNSQYPGNKQNGNLWDRFKDWGRKTIENTLHIKV